MKIIADLEKKTLGILENERPIFRGEYGADKLNLLMNKTLENEYPSITGLLSNGRKIGPFTTDEAYGTETIDGVTYTTASFTLSKANGFTLSEGKTQITIWMNKTNGIKEALGNVTFNVINTTAFDDGDIIVGGNVGETLINYKVELENLGGQVNTFNTRLTNVETNKAEKTALEQTNTRLSNVEENYVDKKSNQTISGEKTFFGKVNFRNATSFTDEETEIEFATIGDLTVKYSTQFDCPVVIYDNPTHKNHAVNKQYVDSNNQQLTEKINEVYAELLSVINVSKYIFHLIKCPLQTHSKIY